MNFAKNKNFCSVNDTFEKDLQIICMIRDLYLELLQLNDKKKTQLKIIKENKQKFLQNKYAHCK